MFGSKDLLFSSETYGVAKSLRFRSSVSAYLNRTFSAGNRKTWTWSGWVKRGALGVSQWLLDADNGSTDSTEFNFAFNSSNALSISGSLTTWRVTTQVFRDVGAWYHILLAVDTTQATANNRIRLYVNGAEITAFSTLNNPTQNLDLAVNQAITHYLGIRTGLTSPLDGYLAEVNFIDGQALTPSSFGFYDNNGIWQPKGYTGTYGTNGFYLKFTDVGATSGANSGYGKDFSGFNTNYWTTNNFNSTSTSTSYDSMYDSPVNASNGITGIGNYCVLNPLNKGTGTLTVTDGNLQSAITQYTVFGTMAVSSGKWYWEVTIGTNGAQLTIGIAALTVQNNVYLYNQSPAVSYYGNDGTKYVNGTNSAYGATFTNGNVIGIALDADNNQITFYKNNTSQGTITGLTSGQTWVPAISTGDNTAARTSDANFGQRPFAYTPPSGFSALNTQNLTTPTITNGASYMAAVTYTGTGSSQTITTSSTNSGNNPNGTTFQPDFVWIKSRSAATDHKLTDVVRGTTKALVSNSSAAETTDTNGLTAFTSSGFTVGSDSNYNHGTGPATYVAWEWNAGGSNATNTSGSITSTVRANTSAGFSVVTYTGTGANATVGHGLGVAPSMVIVKSRNAAANWAVYHSGLTSAAYFLKLNLTDAQVSAATIWNSTAPTSTVFSIGTSGAVNNSSSDTYVAYCFAPVAGYSAMGSYTGNGNADGPMVFTNFRPRWILVKRTDLAESWELIDTSRDTYNAASALLEANNSNAETTAGGAQLDILSNGFKVRNTRNAYNASGGTYIYAAFAENPFKYSRAR